MGKREAAEIHARLCCALGGGVYKDGILPFETLCRAIRIDIEEGRGRRAVQRRAIRLMRRVAADPAKTGKREDLLVWDIVEFLKFNGHVLVHAKWTSREWREK